MADSECPEWTPEQELIDWFRGLDRVAKTIAVYMELTLPLATVRKLLPLADIAWHDKDPSGALIFFGINTPFPRVEYCAKNAQIRARLNGPNSYALPLHPVLELSMGPLRSESIQ